MGTLDDHRSAVPPRSRSGVPERGDPPVGVMTKRLLRAVRALSELLLLAVLFTLYKLGRALITGQEAVARQHAVLVHQAESSMALPSEAAIQAAFHHETLLHVLNAYYTGVHFPLMLLFLVWGYLRKPRHEYHWARNLLVIQTGAAMVVHVVFPLAPPRMFPQWGFVDTMSIYGPSPYAGASGDIANQFAAMPSLHVGWAVLIAYVVMRTGPRWLVLPCVCHVALTLLVVVVTANHWWLDALAGVMLLVVADRLLAALGRTPWSSPAVLAHTR